MSEWGRLEAVVGSWPVEADQGVEVDHPAGLVLDDMLVVSRDFGSELEATQAITRALDVRRSLTLSRACFNRESDESVVVINLAHVVAVRVSGTDSAATGQYP